MLRLALFFFLVAIAAGLLGFGGIAGASADIAQLIFGIFAVLFVGALLLGLFVGRKVIG